MSKKVALLCIFTFAILGFSSCEQNSKDKPTRSNLPRELQSLAIRTAETIAPKDTVTPSEEGGYGFEKLAAELGYETYEFTEDDMPYFGEPEATKGGELISIVSRFPATMRTEGQNSSYVENTDFAAMLYEPLLNFHPVSLHYIPSLATHWKISDDKMHYFFRINPDARFSDGSEVTADDVITTYDLHMDETILQPSDQLVYEKFERPVKEGKYLVSVKCKELNWRNFLYFSQSMTILPSKYLKGLSGTEYLKEYQNKVLPGSGPYTILDKDIKNQLSYAVTRRLDYWDKDNPISKHRYNFDKIKFIVVKDNTSLELEKFKKGEQDFYTVAQARRWIEECDFNAVQKGWVQKRKIFSEKPSGTSGYAFNLREKPFDDLRVRRAFTYLLNREKMNAEMYYNEYFLQNSMYSGSIYENPDNEQVTYNPEKAMELLAEAGYKNRNSDGWLVNDKGDVLRVEIGIPKSIDYMTTPYQQMLKEYGIDLQIKFVDTNALWKMRMERLFTITYISYSGLIFPNPETSLNSKLAEKNDNNNIWGFKNARVDELLPLYDQEFDQDKRVEIIREIDGIVAKERLTAWTNYRPYQRLMFWDKFGYPPFMVTRYVGDYRSIYEYWWYDHARIKQLKEAMAQDKSLPIGEMEVKYWPEYLEKVRQEQMKTREEESNV